MSTPAPEPSSVVRFDLAIQRNPSARLHAGARHRACGRSLSVFPLPSAALLIYAFACTCALVLYALYRRGIDRRYLNPIWMANDVVLLGLHLRDRRHR
jgi:hypothetical protein